MGCRNPNSSKECIYKNLKYLWNKGSKFEVSIKMPFLDIYHCCPPQDKKYMKNDICNYRQIA